MIEIKPFLPLIGGVIAICLWVLTRWFEIWQKNRQKRYAQRNLIRALYAEIDFNTRDLEFFKALSPSISTLQAGFKDNPALVPHITEAKQTAVFKANISNVHLVDDDLIRSTVNFYGLLEKISAQVAGLNAPSYKSISTKGRLKVISHLYETAGAAFKEGEKLLVEFDDQHKELDLMRKRRKMPAK